MSRQIGVAALIYGLANLLSRLIGLVREAVIGRTLGDGDGADIFRASFVLPDYLLYLLAGGAISLVFIPLFQKHRADGDEAGGWRACAAVGNLLGLGALVLIAVAWWLAPVVAPKLAPGFAPEKQEALVSLYRIVLPTALFHAVGGLLSATLQAEDRHSLPALAPLVYTGCIVGAGLIWGPEYGEYAFAWGAVVGAALGPFGLPLLGAIRLGVRWRWRLEPSHPDVKRYFVRALPIMLGFSVVMVDDWLVTYFASEQGGLVAQMGYARTLMKVPMGVFGLALGMAAFPTLSRMMNAGETVEAWSTLVRALRALLLLAVLAQVGLTVAGVQVAQVIWGSGRIDAQGLQDIGLYTGILCGGLMGWSAQGLVARGFYARGQTWPPTVIGTIVVLAMLPVYWWLYGSYGGLGLGVASSMSILVYVLLLMWALRRALDGPRASGPGITDLLVRLLPVAAGATALGIWVVGLLSEAMPPLLSGGIAGGGAVVITFVGAYALKVEETRWLIRRLLRR
ncbi:MAG: murein biosynthesis integral membrane protein MurJ [Bradymonadia bacterium]